MYLLFIHFLCNFNLHVLKIDHSVTVAVFLQNEMFSSEIVGSNTMCSTQKCSLQRDTDKEYVIKKEERGEGVPLRDPDY